MTQRMIKSVVLEREASQRIESFEKTKSELIELINE